MFQCPFFSTVGDFVQSPGFTNRPLQDSKANALVALPIFHGAGAFWSPLTVQIILLDRERHAWSTLSAGAMSALTKRSAPAAATEQVQGVLRRLPLRADDESILRGLRRSEAWAQSALVERYAGPSLKTIRRVLGPSWHVDVTDVLHDAFLEAFSSARSVREAQALPKWMQTVAARAAFRAIRARKRTSWLLIFGSDEMPDTIDPGIDAESIEAFVRTHRILKAMPTRQQAAFALRYIADLELTQVADACEVSLSTIKRTLAKAEQRFLRAAQRDAVLCQWIAKGDRWNL